MRNSNQLDQSVVSVRFQLDQESWLAGTCKGAHQFVCRTSVEHYQRLRQDSGALRRGPYRAGHTPGASEAGGRLLRHVADAGTPSFSIFQAAVFSVNLGQLSS